MKNLLPIIIALICLSCSDVNVITETIAFHNMMETEFVGLGSRESKEFKRFEKLESRANKQELQELLKHDNPIVRTYAFKILLDRKELDLEEAFKMAINNNSGFRKMTGDQILSSDIASEIYFHILNDRASNQSNKNDNSKPTIDSRIEKLDSITLYDIDQKHFLHYIALDKKVYDTSYNDRIVDLALNYSNHNAIFYIDRNNIKTDTTSLITAVKLSLQDKRMGTNPINKLERILNNLNTKTNGR